MSKLDSESEEQFLNRIKKEFKDAKEDLILIADGGFFIGSYDQLDDCFFILPDQLDGWATDQNLEYEVIRNA